MTMGIPISRNTEHKTIDVLVQLTLTSVEILQPGREDGKDITDVKNKRLFC